VNKNRVLNGKHDLHGFELVDALFGVALADLLQGLVLVSALFDIFLVHDVLLGLFAGIFILIQMFPQILLRKKYIIFNSNTF
jgi:hypothetical protein